MNFDLIYTNAVQTIGRTLCWKRDLKKNDVNSYDGTTQPTVRLAAGQEFNLISSRLPNGNHAPAIDLDGPAHLVPSSTPGHFHLYFDKEMPWRDYQKLLQVMTEVGLVEEGYYAQSVRFEQSYLRLPHVKKGNEE